MNLEEKKLQIESDKKVTELMSMSIDEIKKRNQESEKENIIVSIDESFEDYKRKYKDSLSVVIPKVEPIGTEIITTAQLANIMDFSHNIIKGDFDINFMENFKNAVSENQIVVATGKDCRYVSVGDKVRIRLDDFRRIKNPNSVHSEEVFELPLITIDKKEYITMNERNVQYKILE